MRSFKTIPAQRIDAGSIPFQFDSRWIGEPEWTGAESLVVGQFQPISFYRKNRPDHAPASIGK
ncbi:hypothetical protein LEP1GSC193_2443 [Leptospira alstonii serovar Pingchang str. 80-412]|uniref:Uncharacterized protein n=2 Tax=Leptospira alstonii TaxID=28452 RepID=M6D2C5_9LEPT|nr:hypothetical protein LEP1GSC194_2481 [Leptospira alstonii serovar Sichuan str. 79601]EQA80900.1 hypothetical protein LEP1GSC193_2443 [Leptospira alstonii serovar Pingchang str. 80-412]